MINTLPQLSFIFDRRKIASPAKKSSLEIRITHNYKQKYINTGIKLYPNQWKNGKIVNCPDALQISQALDKLLKDVRQVLLNMIEEGEIDIYSISSRLVKIKEGKISFLDFCKQRITIRKYGKASGSQKRYDIFVEHFSKWNKIKDFSDITEANIMEYDIYLAKSNMKPSSRWSNYHKYLNGFILDAIKEGYISKNPYKWVSLDRGRDNLGINKYLTLEEFQKIRDTVMPTQSLEKIRDVFVFQTYTCLRYSDLKAFNPKKIQEIKGTHVYINGSIKTHIDFVVPLLSPALEILHKYNNRLPVITNIKYNEYLKLVAQAAGVDKPITSHWARHTGATMLLNSGVPIEIVSKICGHSSIKITEQIYAKLLDATVVNAIKNLDTKTLL